MRLRTILAAALAASAIAGSASATGSSWGGTNYNTKVLVCYQIGTRTVRIKGSSYYPGLLARVSPTDATRLVNAGKAINLDNEALAWSGRIGCLITPDGSDAVGEDGNDPGAGAPPPPPPPPPPG